MARRRKRNSTATTTRKAGGGTNITIRNDDRAGPIQRRRGGRGRRGRGGGGGGGSGTRGIAEQAIAGMGFGLLERLASSYNVPEIPLLGKKGTIALGCYFLRRQHPMFAKVSAAGFTLAGYQLVTEGKISGDGVGGIL